MLELRYPIDPDAHGVVNGIELAQSMMHNVASLLVTYVKGCPACLDAMFTKIANKVLEELHHRLKSGGDAGLYFANRPDGPERDAALAAHLADNAEIVKALFESEGTHHH